MRLEQHRADRRLRLVVDHLPLGIVVADASGMILLANAAGARLFAASVRAAEGRRFAVLASDGADSTVRTVITPTGELCKLRVTPLDRGADEDAARVLCTTMDDEDTARTGVRLDDQFLRDIIDQMPSLANDNGDSAPTHAFGAAPNGAALTPERARMHAAEVLERCREAIVVTDPVRCVIFVNPAFTAMTGFEAEEIVGRSADLLRSGQYDAEFYDAVWSEVDDVGHWQGCLSNRRKSGELFDQWLSITAVRNAAGSIERYISVASDITNYKNAPGRASHPLNRQEPDRARPFASPSTHAGAERLRIEAGLRRALDRGELRLHYQPQIDLTNGALVGAEALIRWIDPDRGLVGPDEFIPVAEDCGLILPIGAWVIAEVCRQQGAWRAAGLGLVPIAVNVSALQIQRGGFVAGVIDALDRQGVPESALSLEITESVLLRSPDAVGESMRRLAQAGIRLALDDFGTGFSSLNHLKQMPLHRLKIDASFVKGLPDNARDAAIVRAVLSLAHHLGIEVVAEGVESAQQAEFLDGSGCRIAQGFLWSKAVPAADFAGRLARLQS